MANVIAEAAVRVRPDTSGFHQEAQSGILGSLKKVAVAAGGIFVATKIFGSVLSDMELFDKNARQTQAVLKSTGGAAHITAAGVRNLANSIEAYSSIDDQAVTAGENMLLTFRNIRNEQGKGNDIFNQSTKVLADLSTAMGTDMQTSAIQLGKALNDPTKGMTALTRVGVTFSDAQKKAITTMQASGNVMGAQKVILAELNKEFGGSAKALGSSLQGQITLVKDQFADMARDLGLKLVPSLLAFLKGVQRVTPILVDFIGAGLKPIGEIVGPIISTIGQLISQFKLIYDATGNLGLALRDTLILGLVDLGVSVGDAKTIVSDLSTVLEVLRGVVEAVAGVVTSLVKSFVGLVTAGGKVNEIMLAIAAGVAAALVVWGAYELAVLAAAVAQNVMAASLALLNAVLDANPIVLVTLAIIGLVAALVYLYRNNETARKIIQETWVVIQHVVVAAVQIIRQVITSFVTTATALWQTFGGTITSVARAAFNIIKTIITVNMRLIRDVINVALDLIHGRWGAAWNGMKQLAADAIRGAAQIVVTVLRNLVPLAYSAAKAVGSAIYRAIVGALKGIGSGLAGAVKAAINGMIGAVNSALNVIVDHWPDIPGAPGPPFGHNPIPTVARGGIISPSALGTLLVAGERNRKEAVIPLPAKLERAFQRIADGDLGGGGGITINGGISFHTDARSFDALRRDALNRVALGVRK